MHWDHSSWEHGELNFADASQLAACAAVYVLATYNDGKVSQNLLVSKSRVSPKNVSVPQYERVAALTFAKLLSHVNRARRWFDILAYYGLTV